MAPDLSDPDFDSKRYFKIVDRAVDVALSAAPVPLKVLDVGCAEGDVLRELIERVPYAHQYVGVDASAAAIEAARREADDRLDFVQAAPDELPFPAAHFDLVVSSLSFSSWRRQLAALAEIARVLTPKGRFVLVDEAKPADVEPLLKDAGLELDRTETIYRRGFVVPQVRAWICGS